MRLNFQRQNRSGDTFEEVYKDTKIFQKVCKIRQIYKISNLLGAVLSCYKTHKSVVLRQVLRFTESFFTYVKWN